MPHSPTLDRVAAKRDPAAFFASPDDVAESILLTTGEKLATLARWREHLLEELELPTAIDPDAASADAVCAAAATLEAVDAAVRRLDGSAGSH